MRRRGSKRISESEKGKLAGDTVAAKDKKIGEKLIETEKAETGKVDMDTSFIWFGNYEWNVNFQILLQDIDEIVPHVILIHLHK